MSKIRILPEILSNKIAAGEVVERPASVVKELVENALDAASTRIIINVEKGGRLLIRVSDNGVGMSHDDALLAMERYATSKIYRDQDLYAIATLGFRGEALPSIAAVSRFTLVTREAAAESGTEIFVDGGKIKYVSEAGAPRGTMVAVKQLFFNTPARRKFLKSISTEMSHIGDTVARIALGHPEVQLRLTHGDKIVKNWPAVPEPVDRVVDVLGNELKRDLHPIDHDESGISICGWITSPRQTRSTSRGLYVYVNGRFVRDRIIQHALFAGYSQRLVKGQYPVAVVMIEVPFDEVDVNVHPTKNEVRFARQKDVHEAVRRAVAQTLYAVDRPAWSSTRYSVNRSDFSTGRISEAIKAEFGIRKAEGGKEEFDIQETAVKDQESDALKPITDSVTGSIPAQARVSAQQEEIWQKRRFGDLRVIGQFHDSYIVCEAGAGLILIDQHAAHERVLFETFQTRAAGTPPSSQRLLVPETVELGFREAGVLEEMLPGLAELGLEIEPFGGNTFVVKAVPALLADRAVNPLLIEIVEKVVETGVAPGLPEALDHCRTVMACHGAIRAHQPLSDQQIKDLLARLDECDNPFHCPHGRPTWVHWDLKNLEKSFKRIV